MTNTAARTPTLKTLLSYSKPALIERLDALSTEHGLTVENGAREIADAILYHLTTPTPPLAPVEAEAPTETPRHKTFAEINDDAAARENRSEYRQMIRDALAAGACKARVNRHGVPVTLTRNDEGPGWVLTRLDTNETQTVTSRRAGRDLMGTIA